MKEITVDAALDQIDTVTAFVDEVLEGYDCSMKAQMQIDIAIDEIFGNIAHYAYGEGSGKATVQVALLEDQNKVRLTFIDTGSPFNPLDRSDPDVTLSAEDRKIGGLGIFMVKKTMENLQYHFEDGKNIFSFDKAI